MIGWILAFIFLAGDVALIACIRELRNRLIEEIDTSDFLTGRLAQNATAQNNPGAAAPKNGGSGLATSPATQGGKAGRAPLGNTAPAEFTPADLSTQGE
jgi:hypothetical protein